jgi:flagellar hook-length control protein FliK
MAAMVDLHADKDSTDQGGDKAFSGLIDYGLKDLKNASSDTRVDDFASRLAALTQAATPKTANALPVNQPLAMHQSGWTEEVVNRVMYLSSANLKSADIQLQPAELGRLDIHVNMAADQQTQVTFMSAHPAVRDALEGQMHRLRDMFTQQGMGQVDVNVCDQSRGWQGQEQARQGQSRSGGNGGRLDSGDDELPMSVAEVAASTTSVIGSSAVDYYA